VIKHLLSLLVQKRGVKLIQVFVNIVFINRNELDMAIIEVLLLSKGVFDQFLEVRERSLAFWRVAEAINN
jgi:hypothetical protein